MGPPILSQSNFYRSTKPQTAEEREKVKEFWTNAINEEREKKLEQEKNRNERQDQQNQTLDKVLKDKLEQLEKNTDNFIYNIEKDPITIELIDHNINLYRQYKDYSTTYEKSLDVIDQTNEINNKLQAYFNITLNNTYKFQY